MTSLHRDRMSVLEFAHFNLKASSRKRHQQIVANFKAYTSFLSSCDLTCSHTHISKNDTHTHTHCADQQPPFCPLPPRDHGRPQSSNIPADMDCWWSDPSNTHLLLYRFIVHKLITWTWISLVPCARAAGDLILAHDPFHTSIVPSHHMISLLPLHTEQR